MKSELKQEARERWDDEWFIETITHADGDEFHRVHHTVECVADGIVIRDIMKIEDGKVSVDRWLIDNEEYIAEVKSDD